MTTSRLGTTCALLAVVIAGFAGCGDNDEPRGLGSELSGTSDGDAADDHELRGVRRRVNEICSATERALRRAALEELGEPAADQPPPTRAELQRFYDEVVVPTRRGALKAMRRVTEAGDSARYDAYLAAVADGINALDDDLAIIRTPGIEDSALDGARAEARIAHLGRCD